MKTHLETWMWLSLEMKLLRFVSAAFAAQSFDRRASSINMPICQCFFFFSNQEPEQRALCEVTVIPGLINSDDSQSLGPTLAARYPATQTSANRRRRQKVSKVTSTVQVVVYPGAEVRARGIFLPWELQAETVSHLVQLVQHLRTKTTKTTTFEYTSVL